MKPEDQQNGVPPADGIQSEDADLVDALLRGEAEAVATVQDWIRRAALSFRRRLGHEWDDLLQDLHVEVLRLLQEGRFRGESRLKSYLWQVVAHSCLDRVRKAKRWRWTDIEETVAAGMPLSKGRDHLPPWNPARDLLMRVLERTPQGCRRLWQMVVAGLSYQEMSGRVGASEGALRVRVLRCRQQARTVRVELLAGAGGPDAAGQVALEGGA